MSYTEIIPFTDGKPQPGIEFRNAWGGAARIWNSLFDAHVPKKHEYDTWIINPNDDRLWKLATREDLAMFERAVHAFTFDNFYVRNEHFQRFANDLRLFVEKYPVGGQVDHLPAWADWLLANNSTVEAIGLYATSVSENVWYRAKKCDHCGNATEDREPVPLTEGTEVYDWLESKVLPSRQLRVEQQPKEI